MVEVREVIHHACYSAAIQPIYMKVGPDLDQDQLAVPIEMDVLQREMTSCRVVSKLSCCVDNAVLVDKRGVVLDNKRKVLVSYKPVVNRVPARSVVSELVEGFTHSLFII